MLKHDIKLRKKIADTARRLRVQNRWTQEALAHRLGISQNYLSEIERGAGFFTAEQFLILLQIFNAPLRDFVEQESSTQKTLQNTLARLGAGHLQEDRETLPSERLANAQEVIREVLISAESPRHITALAPIIVRYITKLSLRKLWIELFDAGFAHRLGWLLENIDQAIIDDIGKRPISKQPEHEYAKACLSLENFLSSTPVKHIRRSKASEDVLEGDILLSKKTLEDVRKSRSSISRKWNIVTRIQPADFIEALRASRENS